MTQQSAGGLLQVLLKEHLVSLKVHFTEKIEVHEL